MDNPKADAAQNLPPGSTREQAVAWFKARGIADPADPRDTCGREGGTSGEIPNDSYPDDANIGILC